MAGDEETLVTAAAALLTRDHVTLKLTDPETGALLGRLKFTVLERDDAGLPVKMATERRVT